MDLLTLAAQLKTQSQKNKAIVLDQTVLSSNQLKQIGVAFVLGDGKNLTVDGVTPADIPDPKGDTLTIEGGTSSLLNQEKVPMKLVFTISDNKVQALIKATMSPSWAFKDSFPDLVQFPFSNFTVTDPCFIYASAQQPNYPPWSDKPQETITLEAGLNFAAWLRLDGFSSIFTLLADILEADTSYKFFGPFAPTADAKYPVGALSSLLSTKGFSIGYAPLLLTLSQPSFVAQITKPENLIQYIGLDLQATSSLGLDFSLGISSTGDSLTFGATPIAGEPFTATKIMQLPRGGKFQSFIPNELENIFKEVGLNYFTLVMLTKTKKVGYIGFSIGTVEPWDVLADVIKLENIVLNLNIIGPSDSNSLTTVSLAATAQILPKIFTGDFAFTISIHKTSNSKWQVTLIRGQYIGTVKLGDIVNGILGSVTTVPSELNDVRFSDFGISVDKTNNSYVCYGNSEFGFPLLGSELYSTLSINVNYSSTAYTVVLLGVLSIGEQNFSLELDFSKQQGAQDIKLTASWKAQDNAYLELEDIASAFDLEMPKIPKGLDIALESASLTYDFTNKTLVITAASPNLGNAVFVAFKNTTTAKSQFYFGLTVGQAINLSNLPLIDKVLSDDEKIEVEDLQLVIASQNLNYKKADGFNQLIPDTITKLPLKPKKNQEADATVIEQGFNVSAKLQFGETIEILALPIPSESPSAPSTSSTPSNSVTPSPSAPAPTSSPTSDNAKWFKLQKNFGPVHFERVGVQYQDAALWFLLDAALSASRLTLSLDGLAVGSRLSKFEPKFKLKGIGIDYQGGGAVEIGGAFLRKQITKDGKTVDEYDGAAVIKSESFTLSAIGSYAQYDGHPSLFIYAVLDYPLGGPSFFFVTGLAAGFGYNRALKIPTIDQVATFPLVEEAINSNQINQSNNTQDGATKLTHELEKLQQYIPPETGQTFLAVGVKFTSFKIIDSFALLTVAFGDRFEVNLLGLSTLVAPPEAGKTPVAEVQLALKATFLPDEGFLGVRAQLTPNSYVLSKQCHLTGGFAFYSWFAPHEHDGDFVLTLGGYHPDFIVPAHYPRVPRLAFNWQVNSQLNIKADGYFAITASALMAGGHLQATWHSGRLKAWFNAGADFLIAWKPYHYDARIYVDMGVSYSFHILFGTVHISVDVGADLHIWGPEFTGTAHIHLWCVSFTVNFGASASQTPTPIDWATFKDSFLPADSDICTVAVKDGLVRKVNQDDKSDLGVINPKHLCLVINSVIPSNQVSIQDKDHIILDGMIEEKHNIYYEDDKKTKIRPWIFPYHGADDLIKDIRTLMDKHSIIHEDSDTKENLLKKIIRHNINEVDLIKDLRTLIDKYPIVYKTSDTKKNLLKKIETVFKYPKAIASPGIGSMEVKSSELTSTHTITITKDGKKAEEDFAYIPILKKAPTGLWGESLTPDLNGKQFVENTLSGFEIKPKKQPDPGETHAIDRKDLKFTTESLNDAYQWEIIQPFQEEKGKEIRNTIMDDPVKTARENLLTALNLDIQKIDLSSKIADHYLLSPKIGALASK